MALDINTFSQILESEDAFTTEFWQQIIVVIIIKLVLF
jgi:hypothetical protein